MPQSPGSAALRAVPRAGAPRRPRDLRRASFTLLLGLALLGTTVRPAHAISDFYAECVGSVNSLTESCIEGSTSFIGKAACATAGAVGILACAAAEAARQLAAGIRLPTPI